VFITVSASEYGQQSGSSEHVNGSSYSIKPEEFIDWSRTDWVLKKDSAARTSLRHRIYTFSNLDSSE